MDKCFQIILAILWVICWSVVYHSKIEPVSTIINYSAQQREVTTTGQLLNSLGGLIESGFARKPLKHLNEQDITSFLGLKSLAFLRYKKWDFFDVINDRFQLLIHFADLGYAKNVQLLLYVYGMDRVITISETFHNRSKGPHLSVDSYKYEGAYSYQSDSLTISINYQPNATSTQHQVQISFESAELKGSVVLSKRITDDEVVMLSRMSEDGSKFYYNVKSYGLGAKGQLIQGDIVYNFDETDSLGGRDIGRGVWNYNSYWFWAHGQGFINDQNGNRVSFGINLGNGFEIDTSLAYEDSVILNGRLHKLRVVRRQLNEDDLEQLWSLKTLETDIPGSLDAVFDPALRQSKFENFLIIQAKFRRYFGIFKGSFIDENGNKIQFDNIYGFAELHRAKW